MAAETFLERLDRVPLNRFHWKLLIAAGIAWMFAAMDLVLIAFVLTPIQNEFGLDAARTGLVASAGLVGMLVGAAASGRLADRYGRRTVFQATLLLFSAGSLLTAAAPSFELLLAVRIVSGLGLGGTLPVGSTLLAEFAPKASRGRLIVLLGSFWVHGMVLAGLVALVVLPAYGWRAVFLIGALPAFYAAYLRRALPESPRYLAGHGRIPEADAMVRRVEREGGGALITVAKPVAPGRSGVPGAPTGPVGRAGSLLGPQYLRRTVMLWILWFGVTLSVYGLFGAIRSSEDLFGSALAQLAGLFSAAWLVERAGRRPALVACLLGAAVSAILLWTAAGAYPVVFTAMLAFFSLSAAGLAYTLSTEVYPTAHRATGAGTAQAVGLVGAIAASLLGPTVAAAYGQAAVFGLITVALLLAAAAVAGLHGETRARSLEELSPAA